jgi:hypothetical protein
VNVIPSRATVGPNRLRSPLTSMVASSIRQSSPGFAVPFPQWFVRHRRCQHGVGG